MRAITRGATARTVVLGRSDPAEIAAVLGFAAALARLAWFHPELLTRTPGWSGSAMPQAWRPLEGYLGALTVIGICTGWAALSAAVTRFLTEHARGSGNALGRVNVNGGGAMRCGRAATRSCRDRRPGRHAPVDRLPVMITPGFS